MRPGPLALDTEADSFHHYRERVCLVQISHAGGDMLLDPLAGVNLDCMRPVLEDRSVRKVLHGADYDLRGLHRDFGVEIRGVFDTMVAARLAGEKPFGLAALLERHLGVRLDKRHQRADWSLRPLPEPMRAYAVADVRHLLVLHALLVEQLERLGRLGWAEEEFTRLEAVRFTGEREDPESYRKVKGASALDARGLAVVRELHLFRDGEARRRDVPAFKVVRDETLVRLAVERPSRPEELARIPGLADRLTRGKASAELLESISRGLALPGSELPQARRAERPRLDRAFELRLRELVKKRDALAAELGLEDSVLASRGLLEALLSRLDRGEPVDCAPGLRSWQAKLLAPLLRGG